jgi:thiol:disulfide interchange protein DsbD
MIKVDVTQSGNPIDESLLKQYGVKGVPTVVFLDADGIERKDLRLVDFLPPESFLGVMAELKQDSAHP